MAHFFDRLSKEDIQCRTSDAGFSQMDISSQVCDASDLLLVHTGCPCRPISNLWMVENDIRFILDTIAIDFTLFENNR